MSLILNIDTSLETAFVCIAQNGKPLRSILNTTQKEHAGFLHHAIESLITELKMNLEDLSAIAVTEGPGSYTGLRVGMASAKGLCYALNKPFITIGTLSMMAKAAIDSITVNDSTVFCPMIDARRMEVFTALYTHDMNLVDPPSAMILDENSFADTLNKKYVRFFGSGAGKFRQILNHKNGSFIDLGGLPEGMSHLSHERFFSADFTDVVHSEPLYVKEFYSS